jgi:hypothetical protein
LDKIGGDELAAELVTGRRFPCDGRKPPSEIVDAEPITAQASEPIRMIRRDDYAVLKNPEALLMKRGRRWR